MPRGRPKGSKNKSTIEKEKKGRFSLSKNNPPEPEKENLLDNIEKNSKKDTIIELPIEPKNKKSSNKTTKPDEFCLKCKSKLNETPYRVDTEIVTDLASYHREHPRFIKLCRKCCIELSDVIDNWLGDYPNKFDPIVREDNRK